MRDKFFTEPLLQEIKETIDHGYVSIIGGPLDHGRTKDRGSLIRIPLMAEPFVENGPCCTDEVPGPRIGQYKKVSVYIWNGEEK